MTKVKDSKVTLSATGLYNNTISFTLGTEYQYNGKEKMQHLYDYGARWYYPSIGRFIGVDPLAEKFPHISVYNYAGNSPIANIDLWGLQKVHFMMADQYVMENTEGITYEMIHNVNSSENNETVQNKISIEAVQKASSVIALGGDVSGKASKITNYTTVTKALKVVGRSGSLLGLGLDIKGVHIYRTKGSNAPGAVTPQKATEHAVFTLLGIYGGTGGSILSPLYFGFELFYPGGFGQALKDKALRDAKVEDTFRKATGNRSLKYNSTGPYDGIDH